MIRRGTMTARQTFDPMAVHVTSCSVPESVDPGGSVTLSMTIQNDNDVGVTFDLSWLTNTGAKIGWITGLHLPAGASTTPTTTLSYTDLTTTVSPGTYTITGNVENISEADLGGAITNNVIRIRGT